MTIRFLRPLAVAAGIGVGGLAFAAPPAATPVPPAANQQMADAIASKLTTTAATQGADVSLQCVNGVVTLLGQCRSAEQKSAVLEMVRVVPGVTQVRDGLQVMPAAGPIMQAQSTGPVMMQAPLGIPPGNGPVIEPAPLGAPGMAAMGQGDAPPLPNHAWPTYAPYNNYSRVAYPQAYPYNAFPFIGPFYPFPKVPLGWRSVKLEWEDGNWWMGKTSTPHDYWRVRFW